MTLLTQIALATRLTLDPKPHLKHFGWCRQADVVAGESIELEALINEGYVTRVGTRKHLIALTPSGVDAYFKELAFVMGRRGKPFYFLEQQ